MNKFGISPEDESKMRAIGIDCIYCYERMLSTYSLKNHSDSPTIEHFREMGPFYIKDGLRLEDIAICCGSCNSSRGKKSLPDWFKSKYCLKNNINENTVAEVVKTFLERI